MAPSAQREPDTAAAPSAAVAAQGEDVSDELRESAAEAGGRAEPLVPLLNLEAAGRESAWPQFRVAALSPPIAAPPPPSSPRAAPRAVRRRSLGGPQATGAREAGEAGARSSRSLRTRSGRGRRAASSEIPAAAASADGTPPSTSAVTAAAACSRAGRGGAASAAAASSLRAETSSADAAGGDSSSSPSGAAVAAAAPDHATDAALQEALGPDPGHPAVTAATGKAGRRAWAAQKLSVTVRYWRAGADEAGDEAGRECEAGWRDVVVEACAGDVVGDALKPRLAAVTGVPAGRQRLVAGGAVVDDGATVGDSDVGVVTGTRSKARTVYLWPVPA